MTIYDHWMMKQVTTDHIAAKFRKQFPHIKTFSVVPILQTHMRYKQRLWGIVIEKKLSFFCSVINRKGYPVEFHGPDYLMFDSCELEA